MTWCRVALFLLIAGWAPCRAGVELRLDGERVWLQADRESLYDVLAEFAHLGVDVSLDPGVRGDVTLSVEDGDVEELLEEILDSFGYVLVWSVMPGPAGDMTRLDSVQVFRPGRKQDVRPIGARRGIEVGGGHGEPEYVRDEVLIGFKDGIDEKAFRQFLARVGGTVVEAIPSLGIYRIRVPAGTHIPSLVKRLQGDGAVSVAEPNYVRRLSPGNPTPSLPAKANISAAAEGTPALAVLDSGLLPDSGIDAAVVARLDALDPSEELSDPVGHGTQMALIASGAVVPTGSDARGGTVPLVAVRAFDEEGRSTSFDLMESVQYSVEQGARVINMSWGSPTPSDFMADTTQWALDQGAVLVASAGNEPTGDLVYPAAYDSVVAVAALNGDGSLWDQSNYGDFVDVAAPGQADMPIGYQGPPGSYAGTSIASAYVSRSLALYFTEFPDATPEQAELALQGVLADAGAEGKDPQYGYGVLNDEALANLLKKE